MSEETKNLGLFKYNTSTDGTLAFNIDRALNDNWDILDKSSINSFLILIKSFVIPEIRILRKKITQSH